MNKYFVRITGSGLAVRPLEYEDKFINDEQAKLWCSRSLRYYFPVYDQVTIWRQDDLREVAFHATFKAGVTVIEVLG